MELKSTNMGGPLPAGTEFISRDGVLFAILPTGEEKRFFYLEDEEKSEAIENPDYKMASSVMQSGPRCDTETIDHLFLELSQFTQATTCKELRLLSELDEAKTRIAKILDTWNSDRLKLHALAVALHVQLVHATYRK